MARRSLRYSDQVISAGAIAALGIAVALVVTHQDLTKVTELKIFDNSRNAEPNEGAFPALLLVLHLEKRRIVAPRDLRATPDWAKPIVAAAFRTAHGKKPRRQAR